MYPAPIKKQSSLILMLLAALAAGGCSHSAPAAADPKPQAAKFVEDVPQRRDADDTARFLAGMPGKPGSPFLEMESSPAWQEHREILDKAWSSTDSTLVAGLSEFQKAELSAAPI